MKPTPLVAAPARPIPPQVVYIVHSDPFSRGSLRGLLEQGEIPAESFDDGTALLSYEGLTALGCVLLGGAPASVYIESLQEELSSRHAELPVIYIGRAEDFTVIASAMKRGAFDFLHESTPEHLLLETVRSAFLKNQELYEAQRIRGKFMLRLVKLTEREHQVLALALTGMVNKTIALRLKMSKRTTEGHRAQILLKTGADSVLELLYSACEARVDLPMHYRKIEQTNID